MSHGVRHLVYRTLVLICGIVYADSMELKETASGHVRCPQCGFEFRPWLIMQLRDVAVMFGVKVNTVQYWMTHGLPFKLWRIGLHVRRVVVSTDLQRWMDSKLSTPGDDSSNSRIWARNSERGKKGAAQRTLNAARNALPHNAKPTDP